MRRKNRPVKHGPTTAEGSTAVGHRAAGRSGPHHAPGAVASRDERRTFRALPDDCRLARVLRRAGPPVRRSSVRHPRHGRGRRLPAARDAADGVGGRLPARAPRPPAARPRAPPGATCRDRRGLRRVEPDAHRDRAVVQGGPPGHPTDAALGRAAGVPEPPRRPPDRRPAGADERSREAAARRCTRPAGRDRRAARAATPPLRGGTRRLRDERRRAASRSPRTSSCSLRPTSTPPSGSASWPRTRMSTTTSTRSS